MNKIKFLILLTIFIDMIGLGIVVPVLPLYVEKFGVSAIVITLLFSIFALCSFFSAPIVGALSDKFGRKRTLLVSIFSTAVGWAIFAWAPTVIWLFVGRIIDGIAAGNTPVAQAYLADISKSDQERSHNFAQYGLMVGIAFIVGPAIGGLLGGISPALAFWCVAALALFNGILGIFFLPETNLDRNVSSPISLNPFKPLIRAAKDKKLRPSYVAWFLFGLAVAVFVSLFSLFAQKSFGWSVTVIGFIFVFNGIVTVLSQTVLFKRFWTRYFTMPQLEIILLLIYSVGYLVLTYFGYAGFAIGLIAILLAGSLIRSVMSSQFVARSASEKKGEVLGIVSALNALSSGISPLFAGALFMYNTHTPFVLAGVLLLIAFALMYVENSKTMALAA